MPVQEMQEMGVPSLGWEDPLEVGHGNPLQYACLENPHGQRRLAGYNPWGHTESNATKHAHPPRLMIQLEHESGKRAVSVRVLCVKHRNKLWLT